MMMTILNEKYDSKFLSRKEKNFILFSFIQLSWQLSLINKKQDFFPTRCDVLKVI